MDNQVRKLTEGAMMVAIMGVLVLINRQTAGMLEGFLFLFPLPMVFYSAKYGMKNSWIVYVAMVLITMILGTPQSIFYVAAEALIGLVNGSGIYSHSSTRQLLLKTLLMAVVVNVITLVIFASFFGYNPQEEIKTMENMFTSLANQSGVVIPSTVNITQFIKNIMMVSTVLTGLLEGYITHVLSRVLLRRFGIDVPKATSIYEYYPPKWTGYVAIVLMVAYYAAIFRPIPNELMTNMLQGFGICGVFYLVMFGYLGGLLAIRSFVPKVNVILMFLAGIVILIATPFNALFGFLYITTDLHERILKGRSQHVSKD